MLKIRNKQKKQGLHRYRIVYYASHGNQAYRSVLLKKKIEPLLKSMNATISMLMTVLQFQNVSVPQLSHITLYLRGSTKNELQLYFAAPRHSSC